MFTKFSIVLDRPSSFANKLFTDLQFSCIKGRARHLTSACTTLCYIDMNLLRYLIFLLLVLRQLVICSCMLDSEALLAFKNSLDNKNNAALSSWKISTSPCSRDEEDWVGILCDYKGNVWGLKLENMGLSGDINLHALKDLAHLRSISLMNNNFEGKFPNVNVLGALKTVYFSNNKFSGEIPGNAFDGMHSLKKIYLEDNRFTGPIPLSLTTLPRLIELSLQGNKFGGMIPDFKLGTLRSLNVSNNDLQGQIPPYFANMDKTSFSGNPDLCGAPLESCNSGKKSSPVKLLVIMAVAVTVVAVIVAITVMICKCTQAKTSRSSTSSRVNLTKKKATSTKDKDLEQGPTSKPSRMISKNNTGQGKLSFLRNDAEKFDLQDLLQASAEVLGSGYFGASYKAALRNGKVMVVKRFRQMTNVGKQEFQEHMRRLGGLKHPNLLPLVAFNYKKEEKLLVSPYVENFSLAFHLHGNDHPRPKWGTRLKIIKGVANGLMYLHNELPSLVVPHGHLKSSNVLLDESFEPILTDYAMSPIINHEHAEQVMVAYKSPEYYKYSRITKKTDVWSLGILILEILTGKIPTNCLGIGSPACSDDLVSWVNISLKEDHRTRELFDKDLGVVNKSSDGEMMKLLKIALACAEADVEKRCDLKEAIEMIQELKDKEATTDHDDFYSVYTSEGDAKSCRGLSDDFTFQ